MRYNSSELTELSGTNKVSLVLYLSWLNLFSRLSFLQQHNKKIQEKSHAFIHQYENAAQRRNNARESNNANEENLDDMKDNVTEVVKLSQNEQIDIASQ